MQDEPLFSGSVADNISFFDPAADPAWIEHCAQVAAVRELQQAVLRECVAVATAEGQAAARAIAIDLFAQQVHVRPEDVVVQCPLAPDLRLQVFAAHDMGGAAHQYLQDLPPDR